MELSDKTYFSVLRAERVNGETTTFDRGTYTACEACKDNPEKRRSGACAASASSTRTARHDLLLKDSTLELWGMPLIWLPYFSVADPSVTRKSGFLAPHYIARSRRGVGASAPYFWAIAPNMDLTLTPTVLSRQGLLGDVEWRHRLVNGSYNIRAVGIFQADPNSFDP